MLVHRSAPNATDHDRRALLYSYGPSEHRHMSEIFAEMAATRRRRRDQQSRQSATTDATP
jgi:hypothetical protein